MSTPSPGRPGRRRPAASLAAPLAALAGVAAATVCVALVDPGRPGRYPVCPFLWVTGLDCPGCGGLRCVHALTRLDLPAAVGYNALAVALFPLVLWLWGRWAVRSARGMPLTWPGGPVPVRALLAGTAVFWVVRNLPFGSALAA